MENKFWDYTEDYSIQDEVMFVSPKGDGKFILSMPVADSAERTRVMNFLQEHILLLVYGKFREIKNDLPIIEAEQVKYVGYH